MPNMSMYASLRGVHAPCFSLNRMIEQKIGSLTSAMIVSVRAIL